MFLIMMIKIMMSRMEQQNYQIIENTSHLVEFVSEPKMLEKT